MTTDVFVLGVTGYIGGAIFARIKQSFPDWSFAALVRSERNDAAVQAAGVAEIVRGDHSSYHLIRNRAAQADIVLACADCDDVPLAKAILDGLAQRVQEGKPRGILIHTSGTGVVGDESEGSFTDYANKTWNDASEEDIRSIPDGNPHRPVDNLIFEYDSKKLVNAYIIAPSTIYGIGSGPVNTISQQIPTIVRSSMALGRAIIVGDGTNIWNNVHIADLAHLYDLVLKRALSGADASASPYAKFYFGSVDKHVFGDVQREVGKILFKLGRVPNEEAEHVKYNDIAKDAALLKYVANNSVSKGDRGLSIGWKPTAPKLLEVLHEDVETTLKQL